ncbi:MAG: HAD family phosphatase [Deltaproteobacteria bacterium]|jgi:HAD superfamily hydrolase (TIGR01484 family)|nr:HAD family phosphatase [Deltaproteobacteria bacterium]
MESYRKLPRAGVRGLVFDIDDTVTRNGVLDPRAYAAMHQLANAGFELVAVTGRPLGWADVVARQWPVRLAIGENGAGWSWIDGHQFHEGYFCTEAERGGQAALLERIREEVARRMPQVRVSSDHRARRCDLAFDVGELVSLPRSEIDALVSLIEGFGASSSVSTVHAHAVPGPWNKAKGVARALDDALGIDLDAELDRWVFVGDSGNDAEAFAYFPNSVGVANVRGHLDRLSVPPRYVTDAERGDGFAELAEHLLDGRG